MIDAQSLFVATVPTLTILIGILVNNSRMTDMSKGIDELRSDINARFAEQGALFTEKLFRVEQVIDARLKYLEEHLH